ncbi:hypothetical protein PanWU01x14_227110 [Parasponia andersonii]|uniref:RNase H type-1 domain-containing protein n=1 Tax=Parasponia andersonii TaxID=3476 RepID=A0A2P5BMC6_PARAD|nr:hypothetical protein PanWU01x14_227110 [Parasponia andersonii]
MPSFSQHKHGSPITIVALAPPNPGILKLNIDTAINMEADYIGLEAIIRDNSGMVVGAFTTHFHGRFSAFIVECVDTLYTQFSKPCNEH